MSHPPEPDQPSRGAAGEGAHVIDADGTRRLDFVLGHGAHILGHRPAQVGEALRLQAERGSAPELVAGLEEELARRIRAALPGVEMVRFVSSETESQLMAILIARSVTGRPLVVTCAEVLHGREVPPTAGVQGASAGVVGVAYNSAEAAAEMFDRHPGEIAALVVNPVGTGTGCVPPVPGYLQELRRITHEHGTLLIVDEVVTGFRVAYGGAQTLYGVDADLTCLGRVIGGGFPLGACGGRRGLLERVATIDSLKGVGDLSGSPRAMAAGIAVLDELGGGDAYARMEALGSRLADGLLTAAVAASVPCAVNRVGSILTVYPGVERVDDGESARRADPERFARLHRAWSDAGVIWPRSQFESAFLSTAHEVADIDRAVSAFAGALRARASGPA